MKATGIVRRIDDLGRVVIPKEIRRTLRIREGDALEIFTDNQGGVIFKKYSPVGEMSLFSAQMAEVLSQTAGMPALICDRDHIVAAAGVSKREYLERRVSEELEDCLGARRSFVQAQGRELHPVEGMECTAAAVCPILAQSDVNGAVILLSGGEEPPQSSGLLAQVAAGFLAKQLES
ncbi:MAG: AbrB/MazE/SpoVT family DNA-binding domain-containing protein [Oscillospiraceae bacterium]|nr:AbrB/MazE/SpoVT family DNA-binding domain-containing protein [Oscillospiraceae bacterium]MDD3260594.1 stage V sporulation T C-terminal domain-containing protein [Oscillospiraceae bacterium]